MCAKRNEIYRIGINLFENDTEITSDIYTSVSLILSLKSMIVEERMKRVVKKQISPFLKMALL